MSRAGSFSYSSAASYLLFAGEHQSSGVDLELVDDCGDSCVPSGVVCLVVFVSLRGGLCAVE